MRLVRYLRAITVVDECGKTLYTGCSCRTSSNSVIHVHEIFARYLIKELFVTISVVSKVGKQVGSNYYYDKYTDASAGWVMVSSILIFFMVKYTFSYSYVIC